MASPARSRNQKTNDPQAKRNPGVIQARQGLMQPAIAAFATHHRPSSHGGGPVVRLRETVPGLTGV